MAGRIGDEDRPSARLFWSEIPRVGLEAGAMALMWQALKRLPKGDGHHVLVLPGFSADDGSTAPLRTFLGELNYQAFGWEMGPNMGVDRDALTDRFLLTCERADGPISLIGQSLGGVYARELTRRFPKKVRQVITLGSPFADLRPGANNVSVFYEAFTGNAQPMRSDAVQRRMAAWPGVPTTAIYSKGDGVVRWQSAVQTGVGPDDPVANIEIIGSHSGMAMNPSSLFAIADRLTLTQETWRPFNRAGWRGAIYPQPVDPVRDRLD